MRGRIAVIALAVVAIVVAFVGSRGDSSGGKEDGGTTATTTSTKAAPGALRIEFAYSPEKEALVKPLVASFNAAHVRSGGRVVFVVARNVASGDAETQIAAGTMKPTVWSPASSLWGRLLNFKADKSYVADDNPSLVRTPLVIAMWEPMARLLGWPKQNVGFEKILRLARSPQGWGLYHRPDLGPFKLGHTNPDFSTSGLSAVAGEYYAATGKREGLTLADVNRPDVRAQIKAIERSIVHYGDTTLFFEQQMRQYGPGYASAVAMEETTLIDFNSHPHPNTPPLVGLYPSDGAFFSDDPVAVLRAPWVTPEMRAAGNAFSSFIRRRATPAFVARFGFRPGDPQAKPAPPIDKAHGADPTQPKVTLGLPAPEVLSRIKDLWHADRKPANVMLVVDRSGSMNDNGKMEQAKRGLAVFFRQLAPQDRVGLIQFSSDTQQLVPIAPFADDRGVLAARVKDMFPDGETAVFDATRKAVETVRDLNDSRRINAVVLLTDGQDTSSTIRQDALIAELRRSSPVSEGSVRVFTIAYGADADRKPLQAIAAATGGKPFVGDTNQIASVYQSISSFF
jgi:Ca-activated chloride channel homolog